MNFKILFSLIFFTGFLFANEISVAVPLSPYAKIAKEIAKEKAEVLTLIPENSDPHTFEPKPKILKQFSASSIYFTDGAFDKNWLSRFLSVNKNVKVVPLTEGILFNKMEHRHHHAEQKHTEEHEEAFDPHLWTSFENIKIIARNILNALTTFDSENKTYYEKNYSEYLKKINSLSEKVQKIISKLPENKKKFMVFHPSFGYLAKEYHLKEICIEIEGKEVKPKDLEHLIQEAKKESIETIFIMPQFSKRAAASIAKSLNANIVEINPLAYEFENQIEFLITSIAKSIK